MILTFKYRQPMSHSPAAKPLNRRQMKSGQVEDVDDEDETTNTFGANMSASFELRRSGRIVRRVEGAPPITLRNWQPLKKQSSKPGIFAINDGVRLTKPELVYIFRPLVHLGSVATFGINSWKSYTIALIMDLYRYDFCVLKKIFNELNTFIFFFSVYKLIIKIDIYFHAISNWNYRDVMSKCFCILCDLHSSKSIHNLK